MSHVNVLDVGDALEAPTLRVSLWGAGPLASAVSFAAAVPAAPVLVFSDGTEWVSTLDEDSLVAAWLVSAADVADLLASVRDGDPVSLRSPIDGQVYASGSVRVERVPGGTPSTVVPSGGSITVDTVDGVVQVTYSVGGDASPEGIQDVVGAMIVAAGGTYDDEAGTITLPSTGGDTTVQIGTVTLPEDPTPGLSVSVLADSTTVLPEGVTWDSGGEPTITERMLLVFVWSGDDWVGTYGPSIPDVPVAPDTTGPTAGTLGVVVDVTSADGTVTGAADETELDATPYSFRIDAGTWSAYQAGATYEWTGLDPATEYDFQHRVRDAAGNVTEGTVVTDTTDPAPADSTDPTPGTLAASAITSESFTLTVTGASDETALHGTPYAFSTDNGASYSAWQAGATFDASGLTAETTYTCVHKVRDAALNEATGSSIAVETSAAPGGDVVATFITSAGDNLASKSYPAVPIGTPDATRQVVVVLHASYASSSVTATIGGVPAALDLHIASPTGDLMALWVFRAAVPTGTTADVVFNYSGSWLRLAYGVWTLTGAGSVAVEDVATAVDAEALPAVTNTDGAIIAASGTQTTSTVTSTWTNATEAYDATVETRIGYSGASTDTTGDVTITHTPSTTGTSRAVVAIAYH